MSKEPWNAQSAKMLADKQAEKEIQIKTHLNELQKQTTTLTDVKELTRVNIECIQNVVALTTENTETVKQIAKMTEENQKSSKRQFVASITVSITALLISLVSYISNIRHIP